jgi:hypothetical protein
MPSSHITVIGGGGDESSNYNPNPSDFCATCSIRLSYLKQENIKFCSHCGWNLPRKYLTGEAEKEENKTTKKASSNKKTKTTAADTSNSTNTNDVIDCALIPLNSRGGSRRKNNEKDDGLNWLREKGNEQIKRQGGVLLSQEIKYNDDNTKTTYSPQELRDREKYKQRYNRNYDSSFAEDYTDYSNNSSSGLKV